MRRSWCSAHGQKQNPGRSADIRAFGSTFTCPWTRLIVARLDIAAYKPSCLAFQITCRSRRILTLRRSRTAGARVLVTSAPWPCHPSPAGCPKNRTSACLSPTNPSSDTHALGKGPISRGSPARFLASASVFRISPKCARTIGLDHFPMLVDRMACSIFLTML